MLINSVSYTLRKTKGAGTIEFVLGFMLFWWMCMAWAEASFMSYVSALGDLAVSEAARATKVKSYDSCSEADRDPDTGACITPQSFYDDIFEQVLREESSLWSSLVTSDRFQWKVHYLESVDALSNYEPNSCGWIEIDGVCDVLKQPSGKAIAVYRINYEYTPMFNYFMDSRKLFIREAIVIQEYERDQFYLN
ncbi:TadE/TadG family type IV pilus assembly protein [Vibrio agarivorans]|uniref:Pilus assembly protein n=1 Tax=Vibrio agarivorans TaxID=153622 RepID=A0ABT7Y7K5_9VIBR|nr:TadE family protein [Vibrio agarivorans]MDN2483724.1 pilus assembly protein [Vibrio agarivorans]